ncbi:MAG: galactokinase, partial [Phycisphaerae bacterium]|nr:galactokinase [Phycisphaerae bacterium]
REGIPAAQAQERGAQVRIVRAPGRVNLIGEHTDYNGGYVMPMAIPESVWIAFRPRPDKTVNLRSAQFSGTGTFTLGEKMNAEGWLAYPARVAEVLAERGIDLCGIDGIVHGDVPVAAGLSSSAAFEVASALALLLAAYGGAEEKPSVEALCSAHGISTRDLSLLCQEAEHRVGVNCGIMDQFIAVHGRRGCAMMLDCRSLECTHAPLDAGNVRVVIIDTGKQRELADAAYNERHGQCMEGVKLLQAFDGGIELLRDVRAEFFAAHADELPEVIRRRCRHVITEDERVLASAAALDAGDVAEFGRLMNESHESLRDDYEVSCRELDILVDLARSSEGVYGSRMTGAGFGGCTVTLIDEGQIEGLREAVLSVYKKATGLDATVYVSAPSAGASVEA